MYRNIFTVISETRDIIEECLRTQFMRDLG